jgi:arsenate reductase-like glutaredoxin family protein
MLSGVLRSKRAVLVNISIMRAFVKIRQILTANKDLTAKLEELERRVGSHDVKIQAIFEAIKRLTMPVEVDKKKEKIGFHKD